MFERFGKTDFFNRIGQKKPIVAKHSDMRRGYKRSVPRSKDRQALNLSALDGVAEKIILGNQTEILFHYPTVVAKQVLRASFLFEISDSLEEATLTEVYLVALAVMLRTVPPMCLQRGELKTTALYSGGESADVAYNICDGFDLDFTDDLHQFLPSSSRRKYVG